MSENLYKCPANIREKLKHRLEDLLRICQLYDIPLFATVAVEDTETDTNYESVVYGPASHCIKLKDDRIRKHILVQDGFIPVPPREANAISMDFFKGITPNEEDDDEDNEEHDCDFEECVDFSDDE